MEGRTVLITGGSRGIGRAISLRFAKAEAQVFINFFQNRTAAEKTAQDVESLGARVYLHQADLKDEEQIRGMFNEVQRQFGGLDVLGLLSLSSSLGLLGSSGLFSLFSLFGLFSLVSLVNVIC